MGLDVRIGKKILRIIAIYVPHAGYSWNEFELCMSEISGLIMEAVDQRKHCIIAGDFNLCLHYGDRGTFMDDFCNQHQVKVTNGEGLDSAEDSWTFRSPLGTLRRIDYILASFGLSADSSNAVWDVDLGFDIALLKHLSFFFHLILKIGKRSHLGGDGNQSLMQKGMCEISNKIG